MRRCLSGQPDLAEFVREGGDPYSGGLLGMYLLHEGMSDIGGQGSELSIRREGTVSRWIMHRFDGTEKVISVDSRNANSY